MLTASAASSSLLEIRAVTPETWSPVVMVVNEPAGVQDTASVGPTFCPVPVSWPVPARSMRGAALYSGGPEAHPAAPIVAAAAATHVVLTVQNLRGGRVVLEGLRGIARTTGSRGRHPLPSRRHPHARVHR